ncbi:MAG: heme-binding protein [Terracidiphilus sp.]
MDLKDDFVFRPLPPVKDTIHFPFPILNPLGPLAVLGGEWGGKGFNMIWRPNHTPPGQDRFLELNLTLDSIAFNAISGAIPNRGLLQPDINMFGLTYTQQISDANVTAGLHIEPGIWAVVPATSDPAEGRTVVRMASIPHGTTILAQGTATTMAGPPAIPNINILPFLIGNPGATFNFPEQNLANPTAFRSPPVQIAGITQAMVDNPNSVLQAAIAGQTILSTTTLQISTKPAAPLVGGGTANTAFLAGGAAGPNAVSAVVSATFWIETVQGTPNFLQLQYSQLVLLNFNGLSWPHITVATLKKNVPVIPPIWKVDPDIPLKILREIEPPVPPEVGAPIRTLEPAKPTRQFEEQFEAEERERRKPPAHKPKPRTKP